MERVLLYPTALEPALNSLREIFYHALEEWNVLASGTKEFTRFVLVTGPNPLITIHYAAPSRLRQVAQDISGLSGLPLTTQWRLQSGITPSDLVFACSPEFPSARELAQRLAATLAVWNAWQGPLDTPSRLRTVAIGNPSPPAAQPSTPGPTLQDPIKTPTPSIPSSTVVYQGLRSPRRHQHPGMIQSLAPPSSPNKKG